MTHQEKITLMYNVLANIFIDDLRVSITGFDDDFATIRPSRAGRVFRVLWADLAQVSADGLRLYS